MSQELRALIEKMQDTARDLTADAGSWRDAADMTGGHTSGALTRDAVANEAMAAKIEGWADELAAALDASGSGWQPIETCPNDGTTVVLYHHYNGRDIIEIRPYCSVGSGNARSFHAYATHWQPLPSPPDGASGGGRI